MNKQALRDRAIAAFAEQFDKAPRWIVSAPGRVNLIGEHTDYNEGYVLPMAIQRGIWIAFAPRNDRQVCLVAANFDNQSSQFSLDEFAPGGTGTRSTTAPWSNYARGIAWILQGRGIQLSGLNGVIVGDIPLGAGLSSSAALDVALLLAYQTVSGFHLPRAEFASVCSESDNEFVGVRSGIMDQFVSALAEPGNAMLIDCRSMSFRQVPLPSELKVVVCNSMTSRSLTETAYNARRGECEAAVGMLRRWRPQVRSLRDVTEDDLETHRKDLPETILRRCRHVVTENRRVLAMVEALEKKDMRAIGKLMAESHNSLRDDYQVSTPELDLLVQLAQEAAGCVGARLTGAGFGGCTVNLVRTGDVSAFRLHVAAGYLKAVKREPEFYVCEPTGGAGVDRVA